MASRALTGPARLAAALDVEGDVLAEQPAQHRLERHHDLAEVDDPRLQHLAPAEREQLAGERLGALAGGHDLLDVGADRVALAQLADQQLAVGEDHRQHVVEVVGDAAGELADGVHLLRLAQALLEALALGEIEDERHHLVGAGDLGGAEQDRHAGAVAA
jgi:hypothetical protein